MTKKKEMKQNSLYPIAQSHSVKSLVELIKELLPSVYKYLNNPVK